MKLLIIEDDLSIAELQRDYLEIAGYEVEIASDGIEGLRLGLENDYELILVDIMLPGKNGFDICKEIRKQKETPLLVVSAKDKDIDKIRALGLGADDYIVKPFSPGELVARVQSHIARYDRIKAHFSAASDSSSIAHVEKITLSCLSLDITARKVFKGDAELSMTNKEFDLLLYFMKSPETVLSKEDILRNVWGVDACVETATVAVHINRLRDKIEDNPAYPKWIETVWGIGYRFCVQTSE